MPSLPHNPVPVWQPWTIFSCNPRFPVWPQICLSYCAAAALASWRAPAAGPPTWAAPLLPGRSSETRKPQMMLSKGRFRECSPDRRRFSKFGLCWSKTDPFFRPGTTSSCLRVRQNKQSQGHLNRTPKKMLCASQHSIFLLCISLNAIFTTYYLTFNSKFYFSLLYKLYVYNLSKYSDGYF